MKSRKPMIFILLAAVVAVLCWLDYGRRNGTVASTISGNGTVEATEVEISSRIPGRLLKLEAREGEAVAAGRLVAVIDGGDLEGQVAQAGGNLAAAEAALAELLAGTRREDIRRLEAQLEAADMMLDQVRARRDQVRSGPRAEQLEQLRAGTRQAAVGLADAEREFQRAEKLEGEGAIPGRDLDAARTKRDVALSLRDAAAQRLKEAENGARPEELKEAEAAVSAAGSQVKVAQASLDLARAGPRPETIAAARGRVEQARGALSTAQYLLGQTRIVSPTDGMVTLRNAEPGEVVTTGFPIIRLADLKKVWLRVYVPETGIGLVKLGQRAEVTVDSLPGRGFEGVVSEIAQKPEFTPKNVQTKEERVKLVFGVKVEVDNPGLDLKPGMPADAVIRVRP